MDATDAATLIAGAMPPLAGSRAGPSTWADLGAGAGTFTEALARLLGPGARVYAVDRERSAVTALERLAGRLQPAAAIVPRLADFADPEGWRALDLPALDGVVLANALHFVPASDQRDVLARVAATLRPGGRLVVVEYEGRQPSRWVPAPVSLARLGAIVPREVGPFRQVGSRPSAYGGWIYAAVAERREDGP